MVTVWNKSDADGAWHRSGVELACVGQNDVRMM